MKSLLIPFLSIISLFAMIGCDRQNTTSSLSTNTDTTPVDEHIYIDTDTLAVYNTGSLSAQEIDDMIYLRQEEKLARDVYRTLGNTYNINQFKNIPASEQQHTDAIELLLDRYNIIDPIDDETIIGVYRDNKFTTLYETLTSQGKTSLIDALTVGATIEDMNMAKLLEVLENTDNDDILFTYQRLLAQSQHHMQGFVRGLRQQSVSYSPQYISQAYFDSVLTP